MRAVGALPTGHADRSVSPPTLSRFAGRLSFQADRPISPITYPSG
jgi:hypothetical protein